MCTRSPGVRSTGTCWIAEIHDTPLDRYLAGNQNALSSQQKRGLDRFTGKGNCTKCHRPGQVAPFSLLTYDDVRAHARTITTVTQSRYMPPWKPEPGWSAYRDERHLTPEQISLIQQWVDGGMPLGDASKAPQSPQYSDSWQLGTPDQVPQPTILSLPIALLKLPEPR